MTPMRRIWPGPGSIAMAKQFGPPYRARPPYEANRFGPTLAEPLIIARINPTNETTKTRICGSLHAR